MSGVEFDQVYLSFLTWKMGKSASRRGRGPKARGGGRIAKAGGLDCFWEGFLHSTLYLFVCVLLFVFWLVDGLFVDIFLL